MSSLSPSPSPSPSYSSFSYVPCTSIAASSFFLFLLPLSLLIDTHRFISSSCESAFYNVHGDPCTLSNENVPHMNSGLLLSYCSLFSFFFFFFFFLFFCLSNIVFSTFPLSLSLSLSCDTFWASLVSLPLSLSCLLAFCYTCDSIRNARSISGSPDKSCPFLSTVHRTTNDSICCLCHFWCNISFRLSILYFSFTLPASCFFLPFALSTSTCALSPSPSPSSSSPSPSPYTRLFFSYPIGLSFNLSGRIGVLLSFPLKVNE